MASSMETEDTSEPVTVVAARDAILQKLSGVGVPSKYLNLFQPGLVAFVLENPTTLSKVISIILPTKADIFWFRSRISRLLTVEESKSAIRDLFVESLLWLQWLMFRCEPQIALQKLAEKETGQRAVCGAVWGPNDLAYRCRTCEHDPTCAICVPCFQNGNHKDHDYSIIYTTGGCCDCGDITAWKSEGFCSKHVGTLQNQPLPQETSDIIRPVLDAVLCFWKDILLAAEEIPDNHVMEDGFTDSQLQISNIFSSVIVEMLLDFYKYSESLLCFVSSKISQCAGLLELLVKAEQLLSQEIVENLHELLLKSLGEPIFKYEFAKKFIQYYSHTIKTAVKKQKDTQISSYPLLSTFSVQIFTVPSLTTRLVREESLLDVLLKCLGKLFYSCVGKDKHLEVSKWYGLCETSIRVVADIRFCLRHAEIPRYIVNEHLNIFRTWLRLMGLVQGMDPQRRLLGSHIEEENRNLHTPFLLGQYLAKVYHLLIDGAFSATDHNVSDTLSTGDQSIESFDYADRPRHAKIGRLSLESAFCCMENSVGSSLQAGNVNLSVGCQVIPSAVIWLISECLKVMENCLVPQIKASLVTNNNLGFNFLGFPKKLFQCSSTRSTTVKSLSSLPLSVDDLHVDSDMESSSILMLNSWPEILFDVSSQEISFHIPLHRFLSLLLCRAMRACYDERASASTHSIGSLPFSDHDFFSQVLGKYHCCGFSAIVMEAPLCLRVFCAQVRAGMWRRNGDAGILMSEWYHAGRWFEISIERDLFLLQCCAALAPPELFVTRIQERFGLSDYLSLNPEQFNEYEAVLLQEMLTLIVQIVKERRFCGMSLAKSLQREVVHKLSVGNATHSQILRALPPDLAKSKQLQEVIDKVAIYMKPSSMKQGVYSLRSSHWKDLDLYHPRWNFRDLQIAEERFLQHCKISPLDVQLPQWTEVFGPLGTISKIATSRSVLKIVRAVLYYAVYVIRPSECRAPDAVLITALHLLALALDICEKREKLHSEKYTDGIDKSDASKAPILEFATESVSVGLCKHPSVTGKKESLFSLLVTLMRMHKEDNSYTDPRSSNISSLIRGLLKRFSQLNDDCKNELKRLAPDVAFQMSQCSSSSRMKDIVSPSDTVEIQKAKARERQAAILEKMRAEQSKFAANFNVNQKDDQDALMSTQEEVQEALSPVCSLCHDINSKSPLSFLVFLQKSKLSSFVTEDLPTWEECEKNASMDVQEGITSITVVGSSSSILGSPESSISHDSYQADFGAALDSIINRLPQVSHSQSPYLSDTDCNSVPSVEMMERNIYLSVATKIAHHKFELNVNALGLEGLKNGEDRESCDAQAHVASLIQETSKKFELNVSSLGLEGLKNGEDRESCGSQAHVASLNRETSNTHTSLEKQRNFTTTVPTMTDCDGIHISSCGHAVHQECHDRYLSSLKQRYSRRLVFEGVHIANPDMGELLCPVCRRFMNSVLPISSITLSSYGMWMKNILSDDSSVPASSLTICSSHENGLHLPHALSLLQSTDELMKQGRYSLGNCLKAFPNKGSEFMETMFQPVTRKLFKLYFPHRNLILGSNKLIQSFMLWDVFMYSIVSSEISARGRENTSSEISISCIEALNEELQSSNGLILSELLQSVNAVRDLSCSQLFLRFGGFQLFVNSICSGSMLDSDERLGPFFSLVKQLQRGKRFPEMDFWKFVADPVLAHDPFTSLMWIFFSLPLPFMFDRESFLSLVHLFYVVSVVQALITCQKKEHLCKASLDNTVLFDICKCVAKSSIAGKYFVSKHFDESCTLSMMIRKFSFPYLRRCALLSMLLKLFSTMPFSGTHDELSLGSKNVASLSSDIPQKDIRGIIELENMFQICSFDTILRDKLVQSLASKWCGHFLQAYEVYQPENVLYSTIAVPFRLLQLPLLYQDLLERYIRQKVADCAEAPGGPALCLLCGTLCSACSNHCCRERGCKAHSVKCGAGIGVFLLIRRTTILLQRSARRAHWPSLYLDVFGEEDHGMARGGPLYLSNERYLALSNLVASHGLDHSSEVLERTYSFE